MDDSSRQEPDDVGKTRQDVNAMMLRLGISRAELAKRADIPASTVSQWLDGKYAGRDDKIAERMRKWLLSETEYEEQLQPQTAGLVEPSYIETPTSAQVTKVLTYAQAMPEMVLVTLGSGMGKSYTAKNFARTRPNVCMVTMRPKTDNVHTMLAEIGKTLGISDRNPAGIDRSIGAKLQRNGRKTLLIVDEAQQLVDRAVDQLRWFLDEYGCGIALLGNEEVYSRYGVGTPKEGYGQIHRRIGLRIRELTPRPEDIAAYIAAWGITAPDQVAVLTRIGRKPGALGQVEKTIKLASILAAGEGRPITRGDLLAAWQNRGGDVHL